MQPSHAFAFRERQAKPGRSALGGRYPGHHINPNVCGLASRNFFGGAAENQRVAALEADHAFALFCEADHQGIDIVLLA